ncbi:MAG: ATP synthase F1 subunit delta [Actinomycetota bacterium]|nr:ATP synthase F1 subunit delta [Actinomycetota bacterium]MDH5313764.1 ATP synthase F1 subunit delta [Actinomycetota bacterium]
MARDDVIEGYAAALFAVAKAENALPSVEDELYVFAKTIEQNTPLREALTDATVPAENKKGVIVDVLGDRANPLTVSLLGFVVDAGRAREIPTIVQRLAEVAAQERDHALAEVRSAVPLNDDQRDRIAAALSAATGRAIDVKVVVDPSVVGGVVARVGDEIFDGSLATRLEDAKQRLGSV